MKRIISEQYMLVGMNNTSTTFVDILPNQQISEKQISDASSKNHPLFNIVEETLKGKEMKMPAGLSFFDKDGTERSEIRIKMVGKSRNFNLSPNECSSTRSTP
jgi:hypothetical protein